MPAAKQDKYLASLPLLHNPNQEDKQLRIGLITAFFTRSYFSWGRRKTRQEKCTTKQDFPRPKFNKDLNICTADNSCSTTEPFSFLLQNSTPAISVQERSHGSHPAAREGPQPYKISKARAGVEDTHCQKPPGKTQGAAGGKLLDGHGSAH